MSLQITGLNWCKATLVTFVRLLTVLIFHRDSHRIWRSAHSGDKFFTDLKTYNLRTFLFDPAALFKLSLSFKNHAIYPQNSYFSLKFEQKELSVFVCTNVGRVPLISGAAGTVYVSRSMQIKIGFSYANRAKCFCKSTCLCVCKSGASNVSINNVHRLNWTIALQIKISRFRTCLQHNVFNHIWKLIRKKLFNSEFVQQS